MMGGIADKRYKRSENLMGWELKKKYHSKLDKYLTKILADVSPLTSLVSLQDKVEIANLIDFKNRYNKQKRK